MKNKLTSVDAPELPCVDAKLCLFPGMSKKEIELIERAQLITQQFDLLQAQVKEMNDPACNSVLKVIGHQRGNVKNLAHYLVMGLRK